MVSAIMLTCDYAYSILEKEKEFLRKQLELAEVNRRQVALAHLKTQFDALEPDITLICEKLVLFAEIWSSVGPFV